VEIFLNVVIGLGLVISVLVILLAMYTTIIERTREIGILKSLGASKRFIIMTIEKEAALISAMGVVLGFAGALIGKLWLEANTRLMVDLGSDGRVDGADVSANLDPVEAISYD